MADDHKQPADEAAPKERTEVIGSVSLVERLEQGGTTMIFLLLLSIAAVAVSLERAVNLRKAAIVPDSLGRPLSSAVSLLPLLEHLSYERLN